ncbi:hypothetical protein A2U01_0114440, partial [Trifolium medium]|nr:hypothetical protein [Trifolium medium]
DAPDEVAQRANDRAFLMHPSTYWRDAPSSPARRVVDRAKSKPSSA